ncbi:glycosyltransferase family 2 protein [Neobacillus mesonae]|nr:glycosyltransferase family 2 protein [Neobacillus mesonae]
MSESHSYSISPVRKTEGNKLTAMLQVRNESIRYLKEVLEDISTFVDSIVIVDDASTDDTLEICKSAAKVEKLVTLAESLFHQEWKLRTILWQTAASTSPDWILAVDADELYEERAKRSIRNLINQDRYDWVSFRLYDLWGSRHHYREDELWQSHKRQTMTLVRYFPDYPYLYPEMPHHVPRLPLTCGALQGLTTDLRIKHLGWAGPLEERVQKYVRYKKTDPEGKWGSTAQYESILDLTPTLVEWKEEL